VVNGSVGGDEGRSIHWHFAHVQVRGDADDRPVDFAQQRELLRKHLRTDLSVDRREDLGDSSFELIHIRLREIAIDRLPDRRPAEEPPKSLANIVRITLGETCWPPTASGNDGAVAGIVKAFTGSALHESVIDGKGISVISDPPAA
jgi:hypothetical protein